MRLFRPLNSFSSAPPSSRPCPSASRTTSIIALRQRRTSSFLPLRQRRTLITIFSLFFSLKSLFYWNQFTICIRCWIITLYYLYNWHQ
ncbi:hypothetical protein L2E82_32787 [Cichorium intybus]|uniref:Uncharacterized protein n=1 Tax=Cichorium intybus TaxID=13427 RepID=A0ACB9BGV2_CICIN|nr:hypothetical protein L2E82_32787 [Cichorium intybus]